MHLIGNDIETKIHNEEYGDALEILVEELRRVKERLFQIDGDLLAMKISLNAVKKSVFGDKECA